MKVLAPFAPTLCSPYLKSNWPDYDESKLVSDTVTIAMQIGGKMRGTFQMKNNATDEEVEEMASKNDNYNKIQSCKYYCCFF